MATEAEVVRKVLNIAERELTLEEYARFLAAIAPKVGDSVKEVSEFCDTEDKFLAVMKQRGGDVILWLLDSLRFLSPLSYERRYVGVTHKGLSDNTKKTEKFIHS